MLLSDSLSRIVDAGLEELKSVHLKCSLFTLSFISGGNFSLRHSVVRTLLNPMPTVAPHFYQLHQEFITCRLQLYTLSKPDKCIQDVQLPHR